MALPSAARNPGDSPQDNAAASAVTNLLVLELTFSTSCAGGTKMQEEWSNCSVKQRL